MRAADLICFVPGLRLLPREDGGREGHGRAAAVSRARRSSTLQYVVQLPAAVLLRYELVATSCHDAGAGNAQVPLLSFRTVWSTCVVGPPTRWNVLSRCYH